MQATGEHLGVRVVISDIGDSTLSHGGIKVRSEVRFSDWAVDAIRCRCSSRLLRKELGRVNGYSDRARDVVTLATVSIQVVRARD